MANLQDEVEYILLTECVLFETISQNKNCHLINVVYEQTTCFVLPYSALSTCAWYTNDIISIIYYHHYYK